MRIEKVATLTSSATALVLVLLKATVALLSGSVALLASAIDSLLDFSVSIFNFYALTQSEKGSDSTYNFGRGKFEPLAALLEGTIISISALFIAYEAILKLVHHREVEYLDTSIVIMLISLVITIILVVFLNYVAKKNNNLVIKADALHYKTDIYSNIAVLASLVIIYFTDFEIIDSILGFAIAIYMIYSAIPIVKDALQMLLDVSVDIEDLEAIKNILAKNRDITDYHFLKTRQSGDDIFISAHLVFTISTSLYDAHKVSDDIELELKNYFKNKNTQLTFHLDPYDDKDINLEEEMI